ncbi:MAG TPA: VWA domain-containing protein [Casimicrobiaceae bacterium]|nr:VWA domain-containing protein [Casimicrobiaceae bacterium]
MTFVWPQMLWLLLAAPVLVAVYVWALRRKRKHAVRYADLGLVKEALGPRQRLRRHIPPLLFLIALVATIFAIARPSAVVTLPSDQRTTILAIDVSLSMRASDVKPSRMVAAQTAAKAFVQEQPADVRVGIVSFAGTASVVQPPTHNRDDLIAAIDRFELQRHTAIGSGIIVSLATLFPEEGIDLESLLFGPSSTGLPMGKSLDRPAGGDGARKPFKPVPPGSNGSSAIILLTDGRRTTGPDSLDAAKLAADHGVRIYTVGFGMPGGGVADMDGYSMYMAYDEETLKAIAEITRGEYFHAASATELAKIYQRLNARYVLERKETEVGALAVAAAAVLLVAAGTLSLLWFNRSA